MNVPRGRSRRLCTVAGCGRHVNARDLCMTHYARWTRHGTAAPSQPIRATEIHGHFRGHAATRTYATWGSMITRCYNPRAYGYRWYGARGIQVCAEWRASFAVFLADMGERPPAKSLDRIDVNGDYTPTNCRWATLKEQAANKRRVAA